MNITRGWKKYMACGCSHGDQIDPEARDAIMRFAELWKPVTRGHLGDAFDMAAFRSGAVKDSNSTDHAKSVQFDTDAGLSFLTEYRPTFLTLGNHDDRLWNLVRSPNAILSHAARKTIEEIEGKLNKLKTKVYEYSPRQFHILGNTKFLHGFVFNVAAIRDTAETYGRMVMAHIHRTGEEQARTIDGATGYAAGMLMRFDADYSKTKRQSLAHKQGFVWGEYCDDFCTVNVCSRQYGQPWRLPL